MLVNSEMKDNCRCCRENQGEETLNKECSQLVVCEHGKFPIFQEEPKVSHGGVNSQELTVAGGVK